MTLRTRFISVGAIATGIPLTAVLILFLWQENRMAEFMASELDASAKQELAFRAHSARENAAMAQELMEDKVRVTLAAAQSLLEQAGTPRLDEADPVAWTATNQVSRQDQKIELPKLYLGDTWLGQTATFDASQTVPLVDEVLKRTGETCTVFQNMNARGDLLRVATNVRKTDGKRAIGTFIPHTSPVAQTILRGETFYGRAYVVNQYYLTAYTPLRDAAGHTIGVLYVGTPEAAATVPITEHLAAQRVAQSGGITVLNAHGDMAGNVVLGSLPEEAGSGGWDATAEAIVKQANQHETGTVAHLNYTLSVNGTDRAYQGAWTYFPDWDWVILASAPEDELHALAHSTRSSMRRMRTGQIVGIVVSILFASGLLFTLAIIVSRQIRSIVERALGNTAKTSSVALEITSASQRVAQGANTQASSLEESSASLEEISGTIRQNAERAQRASELTTVTRDAADAGAVEMQEMTGAMEAIASSSNEISTIIKTIDEIAFQTNLLALNAAVEAARAGESGLGFAVVAEEVRALAQRSTAAARETSGRIEEAVRNGERGAEICGRVAKSLGDIVTRIRDVDGIVGEISTASAEQTNGISQISRAVNEIDRVTQENAAGAEQTASAASELRDGSHALSQILTELLEITDGHVKSATPPAEASAAKPSSGAPELDYVEFEDFGENTRSPSSPHEIIRG